MSDEWDNTAARSEGWLLWSGRGCIIPVFRAAFWTGEWEASKGKALAFVQQCAAEGSAYHIEALARTQLL